MIAKTVIKTVSPQYINSSLNILQSRVDNVLNKEIYMADIEGTYAALLTYYNLLANKLGKVTVSYTSTSSHSSKMFITKVPKSLTIPNINETFRLVNASFEGFISLILSDYSKMYGRYSSTVYDVYGNDSDSGMLSDASSYTEGVRTETQAIIDEIINTGTATKGEIQQGLEDARTEAGTAVEEAAEEASTGFDDAWGKAGGHETTEDMIEKAQEAIDNARNEAAKAAENARNQENAERAHNAAQGAQDDYDKAMQELDQATKEYADAKATKDSAYQDYINATGTERTVEGIVAVGGGYDYESGTFTPGTYTSEAGGGTTTYTITDNGDGTVTITTTYTASDGSTGTSTITTTNNSEGFDGIINSAADEWGKTSEAYQDAAAKAEEAQKAEAEAQSKADSAKADLDAATKAAQEADDANIANATSEELESGWYNDSGSEGVAETDQGIVDDFNDMFDDDDGE